MPPNRVPRVPRLTAPLLPYRVEAPTVTAGVDERFRLQLVFPGMVGKAKPCDGVVFSIRAKNESVLGCFRIKYHEDAAVARRRRHRARALEPGHDFVRDAGDGLTRLLT
jgi:hypothetical protein